MKAFSRAMSTVVVRVEWGWGSFYLFLGGWLLLCHLICKFIYKKSVPIYAEMCFLHKPFYRLKGQCSNLPLWLFSTGRLFQMQIKMVKGTANTSFSAALDLRNRKWSHRLSQGASLVALFSHPRQVIGPLTEAGGVVPAPWLLTSTALLPSAGRRIAYDDRRSGLWHHLDFWISGFKAFWFSYDQLT